MKKTERKPAVKLFLTNCIIIIASVMAMAVVCLLDIARSLTDTSTFAAGVTVDGYSLAGMTYAEAESFLCKEKLKELNSLCVTISCEGKDYTFSGSDLGLAPNTGDVITMAFGLGKNGKSYGESVDEVLGAEEFHTSYYVDSAKLKVAIEKVADETETPAKPATAEFNAKTRIFTYKEGTPGMRIDVEAAQKTITDMLVGGELSKINLERTTYESEVTVQTLKANTVRLASWSTSTTRNINRNNNINLMCEYVNGYVILPGETLSINELVGQRTAEKGFLPAPAIMDGKRLQNDLGGGICQLSGTLLNAALWANLDIVERYPHSWPSEYVDIGMDSTLDWNTQKDLKLRNMSEYPVYIAAWLGYDDLDRENVLNVEIYGQPLPQGVTIDIDCQILETIDPPETNIVYTSSLPSGCTREAIKARTGYRTVIYRVLYKDGEMIDREKVSMSYYRAIQGEMLVGKRSGGSSSASSKRTQTPNTNTPSPTNEPTPSPTSGGQSR